jgi:hypothetical protein
MLLQLKAIAVVHLRREAYVCGVHAGCEVGTAAAVFISPGTQQVSWGHHLGAASPALLLLLLLKLPALLLVAPLLLLLLLLLLWCLQMGVE